MMQQDTTIVLQEVSLTIYKRYKEICEKYGLRYFGIGGTCIGAIRHGGFIPWDDDLDVAMPYSDMLRFIEVSKTEFGEEYELYNPIENMKQPYIFIKMCKKNTTCIHEYVCHSPEDYFGIFIDIFPIFGMPKESMAQIRVQRMHDMYLRLNFITHGSFSNQHTILGKLAWLMLYPFKERMINSFYWTRKIIGEFSVYPFENSDKILFAWRLMRKKEGDYYNSVFEYDDFKTYIEMKFEDTMMRVPVGYDRYLTEDFGDYMTMPPIEKRVPAHRLVVVDPNKSYKEYIGKI